MQVVKSKGSTIEFCLLKSFGKEDIDIGKTTRQFTVNPTCHIRNIKLQYSLVASFGTGKNWKERKKDHKSNKEFWHKKIEQNVERGKELNDYLLKNGWQVLSLWGREIEHELVTCVQNIESKIDEAKRKNIT